MRLAAIASALAIVLGVAVFGAIFLQKASIPAPASSPATAQTTPTEGRAPGSFTTVADNAADSAMAAPVAVAQATPAPAPQAAPMPSAMPTSCSNPNALGVARVVEIDTTGGPGFGFEHFKSHDFLREGEVVLTFDDGPWPKNTPAVLTALADECTKGVYFAVGKHAGYHPEILQQFLAAGHTVGTHTWSHVNLNSKKMTEQQVKDEMEKGWATAKKQFGQPPA